MYKILNIMLDFNIKMFKLEIHGNIMINENVA